MNLHKNNRHQEKMAEAVVVYFLQKLSDILFEEVDLIFGVDRQVRSLKDKLDWMLVFIKAAEVNRRENARINLWVTQIREVTFLAEDVIDEFMVKINCQNYKRRRKERGLFGYFTRCVTCTQNLPILHELAYQIQDINTRIEEITLNRSKFGIERLDSAGESSVRNRMFEEKRPPIVEESSNVVGNEDSIREVKSLLMGGEPRRVVVSIVGMGGLGKTTLAKKVYQSNEIKRSFNCFAWVHVSLRYETKELLLGILNSLKVTCKDQESEEELRKKLRKCLESSKYLIVVDDVWSVEAWNDLSTAFPDEENGSRVLITTRNKDVSLHVDPSKRLHELRCLNEVESWELFIKKIFPLGRPEEDSFSIELEDLGRKMVAKCGGLPLAIVVLGGLLSRKSKTQIAWSKVYNSVSWQLSTHGTGSGSCLGILASSYYDLPYYLKSCFLYMGHFPEHREIRASKLFHYWIAEGFIQSRGEQTMEDVAEDYMEELIQRSMIQVARRKSDGTVKACRIHDLLRDLAISEAREEQFFEVYKSNGVGIANPKKIRRLAIHEGHFPIDKVEHWGSLFGNTRSIRSLMCYRITVQGKPFYQSLCASLKLLRVLELDILDGQLVTSLPEEIGDLIHLKYLCLKKTCLDRIPSFISRLVNLQCLDIKTTNHETIPSSSIWSLTQLRHLNVHGFPCISINGKIVGTHGLGIDNLKNLQTLRMTSGSWMEGGGLGQLRALRNLVIIGSLAQYQYETSESIKKLHNLRMLELHCSKEIPNLLPLLNHKFLYKLLLDGILSKPPCMADVFPPNLNKLTLSRSQLESDPMEVLEKLPNLKILELLFDSYVGEKLVCSKGGFPKLQVLQLCALDGLEEWVVEEGALISLKCLVIGGCGRLKMLPDGLKHLSKIEELKLFMMPDEFTDRVKENFGDDWKKIRHIPFVNTGFRKLNISDLYRTLSELYSNEDAKYPQDVSMLSRIYDWRGFNPQ